MDGTAPWRASRSSGVGSRRCAERQAAVYIGRCAACTTGIDFELHVLAATSARDDLDPSLNGIYHRPGGGSTYEEMLRFGVAFAMPRVGHVSCSRMRPRGSGAPVGGFGRVGTRAEQNPARSAQRRPLRGFCVHEPPGTSSASIAPLAASPSGCPGTGADVLCQPPVA